MIQLKDIHTEIIELENAVTLLKEEINTYENSIIESKREKTYDDYMVLIKMYDDLFEKDSKMHYLKQSLYVVG